MKIANSYIRQDGYYEFVFDGGVEVLYPESSIILVDDESGLIAVKLVASNETVLLVRK